MQIPTLATHWIVPPRDRVREADLARALNVPELIACLLINRGIVDAEQAHRYLHPSLDDLGDPTLLPDYAEASRILLDARERKTRVFVHGDYDVDGVSSAAIFDRFLRKVGFNVHTHVPHRIKEGYGIHASAVEAAKAMGADVFLTCDCGISAFDQIAAAREAGMRVVVTDHHSIGETMPQAHALINPHRSDSRYPFAELSGAGVVFRFCEGLTRELGLPVDKYRNAFLDLAALGTVADVMPLEGENRILARYGLLALAATKKIGLRALLRESGVEQKAVKGLRAYHIGYVLGPRLNAAGRIDDAAISLRLLLSNDEAEAAQLARQIEQINEQRRAEQLRILDEACAMVLETGANQRHVIVVASEGWHAGVIGIVAGRLVEQFQRPAFVGSIDSETGRVKGSARTIPSFHLYHALQAHTHLMEGGGHAMAAGFSADSSRMQEIADALDTYARGFLTEEDFAITRRVDAAVDPEEITPAFVAALNALEPFGDSNPEPMFVARDMSFAQITPTRKPEHVQVTLRRHDGPVVQAMGFSMGPRLAEVQPGERVDVMFQPELDEYRGVTRLKWILKDYELFG